MLRSRRHVDLPGGDVGGTTTIACLGALVLVISTVALVGSPTGAGAGETAEPLRLNHVQAKGSHNSYHIEPPQDDIDLFMTVDDSAYTLQYTHPPLGEQLDLGFRQFELDVFADPAGELFEPNVPGFKVRHIDVIDEGTRCALLTDCLEDLEQWSALHPGHMPITVLLEMKEPIFTDPSPITPERLHELDDEIRSVLDDDQLVTPDFVRGVDRPGGADGSGAVYDDVESAVLDHGWPLLEDVRDRFLILLDNERADYVDGDPTLAGRVAFPPSNPGNPDAAFLKRNDPRGANEEQIRSLVEAGYVVRTRSDLPVETGLTRDDTRQQAALASGAHWVSGDYLHPDDYARYDADYAAMYEEYGVTFDPVADSYQTVMPGGTPARCNPVIAPPGCESVDVEDLEAPTFSDVGPGHPFFEEIEWAAAAGVTEGFADGTFRPAAPFPRQAAAAFAHRLAGAPAVEVPAVPTFSDVGPGHPFFEEIEWAAAAGVTEGFADGTFRPAAPFPRQAAAAFAHRLAGAPAVEVPAVPTFSDVGPGHPFFEEIEWTAAAGVTEGFADGTFRPATTLARQGAAAFAARLDALI
ncbi:MAG: Ca2+-dependent phosphoinositide-specific phospholipase C [Acidimicrobiia bacterium]|nr:Ca2+-dependent phosphoinositide-specific phospholipase C [Acidimicrobiia bacterium]